MTGGSKIFPAFLLIMVIESKDEDSCLPIDALVELGVSEKACHLWYISRTVFKFGDASTVGITSFPCLYSWSTKIVRARGFVTLRRSVMNNSTSRK